jgi:hypothetical protein
VAPALADGDFPYLFLYSTCEILCTLFKWLCLFCGVKNVLQTLQHHVCVFVVRTAPLAALLRFLPIGALVGTRGQPLSVSLLSN